MAKITLKGNEVRTNGELPGIGDVAPDFVLTGNNLNDVRLSDYLGKKIVLNIFPSLDTAVCALSVRRFNAEAEKLFNTVVLCISRDLPFAQSRFCGAEGLNNVITLSEMRDDKFSADYRLRLIDGPLAGLLARAVILLNESGVVDYVELVPEIAQEPDYEAALKHLKKGRS